MSIRSASMILDLLPLGVALAVGVELDRHRPYEAHRILTQVLGDGEEAAKIIAALICHRYTGR